MAIQMIRLADGTKTYKFRDSAKLQLNKTYQVSRSDAIEINKLKNSNKKVRVKMSLKEKGYMRQI